MAKVPYDQQLDFLKNCTQEELAPLVGALLGTNDNGEIDKTGRISSELNSTDAFKKHFPDHTKYVDEIIEEIQTYGGNTFANLFRGCGVPYHEILCDVATKMKVNFNKLQPTEMIEQALLAKVLTDAWEHMSEEEKKSMMQDLGKGDMNLGGIGAAFFIALFRAGGFASYKWAMIIVNAVARAILGRGLAFGAGAAICHWLAVFSGPVGWAITGIWTLLDLAAPAFRVTVPACIYVAALRNMKENERFALENEANLPPEIQGQENSPANGEAQ